MSRIEEVLRRASQEAALASVESSSGAASTGEDEATAFPAWDFGPGEDATPPPARLVADEIVLVADEIVMDTLTLVPPPAPVTADAAQTPLGVQPAAGEPVAEPSAVETAAGQPAVAPAEATVISLPVAPPVNPRSGLLVTATTRIDAIEQYRNLAAALHEAQLEKGLRSVLCTSAVIGEGKTLTAANLALTLSESYGRRVLLIDADLRQPQIHSTFNIPNDTGLADVLSRESDHKLQVRYVSPRLGVVTAGAASRNPMRGLASERLRRVIAEAADRFDWVILDTPPALILPDARVLVSMVDTVLMVVRANATPFRLVQRAVDVLRRERIFGVVLNGADEHSPGSDYAGYHHYYYGGTRPN